jgi:hypothetical protein
MRHERSIITAGTVALLLTAGSCGDGSDGGDFASRSVTTEEASAASSEVTYDCPGPGEHPVEGPVQVVAAGLCSYDDGLGRVTYGLVVENTGPETVHEVLLDVDVNDSTGANAGRAVPHFLFELRPGEEIGIGYSSLVEGASVGSAPESRTLAVRVEIPEVLNNIVGWADANVTVSDVSTSVERDARTTTFSLSSTYDFPLDGVEVYVVYRNDEGAVLGGEADLVPRMEAHGTVAHTITSDYVNPGVTQAQVFVNDNPEPPQEPAPPPQ